jgi:hypothetical protein
VALDEVAVETPVGRQRAFEIHLVPDGQVPEVGSVDGFGGEKHLEPAIAERFDGETGPADADALSPREVLEAGSEPEPRSLFAALDGDNLGGLLDDSSEHTRRSRWFCESASVSPTLALIFPG